jgi:hypothetical protein
MKNSVTSIIPVVCLAAITAVVSFAGVRQASAADSKVFAGANCVRWNETVDPRSFISYSRRFNPSGKRLRLDCQAVKDNFNGISSSWIRVIDRSPIDQVCVRIAAVRQSGSSFLARLGTNRCTSKAFNSTSAVQLNTGALNSVWGDAHYYVSVNAVPASYFGRASGVVSYLITER